jgi:dephospho-CoA kinase|tara:strand:- start:797 stop:1459 length:663 start_codon:yes stop_codon:yes gene_type:complete
MITLSQLREGVYDPNIFKAIFLAGGPGSGKSYVAGKTIRGQGLKMVNSDIAFEKLLKKAGLSLKMPEREEGPRIKQRDRAKALTKAQTTNYIEGRLGLVIDGTGKNFDKITKQAAELQQLGYDTYMVFVNTSLDVALERNATRERSLPENIVAQSWKEVQANIGKFSLAFKQGMIIVDNNDAKEEVFTTVYKRIRSLLKKPVQNGRAKQWIRTQLDLKKR